MDRLTISFNNKDIEVSTSGFLRILNLYGITMEYNVRVDKGLSVIKRCVLLGTKNDEYKSKGKLIHLSVG